MAGLLALLEPNPPINVAPYRREAPTNVNETKMANKNAMSSTTGVENEKEEEEEEEEEEDAPAP